MKIKKPIILAIIPARGGSKGIPNKNIKLLANKPLIAYTIEEAFKSRFLDRVIVSTDNSEIANISKKYGAEVPFMRPKNLAEDTTPMHLVLQHAVKYLEKKKNYKIDIIVRLQPTSPFRKVSDIDAAIEKLLDTNADVVETVSKLLHPPFWIVKLKRDKLYPFIKTKKNYYRRQDSPKLYVINGAVYVIQKKALMKKTNIFDKNTRATIMEPDRSIDIDTPLDFKIAELLLKEELKYAKNKDRQ
jgi:N-acylneuraminate cytidylyltransferase/CMP-N,N'-diacetyllegionaminic acid synthase